MTGRSARPVQGKGAHVPCTARVRVRVQVRLQVLQASMGRPGTHGGAAGGESQARRLHELFTFKLQPLPGARGGQAGDTGGASVDPGSHAGGEQQLHGGVQHLCRALSVIAGSSLQVLVVADGAAARAVLQGAAQGKPGSLSEVGLLGAGGARHVGRFCALKLPRHHIAHPAAKDPTNTTTHHIAVTTYAPHSP